MGAALIAEIPVAGAIIIGVGIVLEITALLCGSEDDHVDDVMIVFDKDELQKTHYRTITANVSNSNNDWTLYLGVESKKQQ